MFFLRPTTLPQGYLDRAIYALLEGRHGWASSSAEAYQERVRRAKYYESYASTCIRSAFSGTPPLVAVERNRESIPALTDEHIRLAADALFDYRGELLYSELKRECTWMLQGYLGLHLEYGRGWNDEGIDPRGGYLEATDSELDIKLLLMQAEFYAQKSLEHTLAELHARSRD